MFWNTLHQTPLTITDFVRRFPTHILPKRLLRIRQYRILSTRRKRGKLQILQSDLKVERSVFVPRTFPQKSRYCRKGNLVRIAIFGKRHPPHDFLFVTQNVPAK
ncbi:transposase [Chryseobacterium koreense]|uniref:transposase n=1 Tax=Chryseobacterium koreense TaxID=232216 RepID=UPI0034E948E2